MHWAIEVDDQAATPLGRTFIDRNMAIALYKSTTRDLGFVFSLAQNGVRHGHFDLSVGREKETFRGYLNSVIANERDLLGRPAQLLVAFDSGQRVGASLVAKTVGMPDDGVELAMIAVKNEHRGKGYGADMLDALMNRYLPQVCLYGRCFPASEKMRQMLLRRRFSEVGKQGDAVILRHESMRIAGTSMVHTTWAPLASPAIEFR